MRGSGIPRRHPGEIYTRVKLVIFRLEILANFQIFYTVLDSKLIALISEIIIKIKN